MTGDAVRVNRRGLMFVLSSPSGAGKTTMSRRLLVDDPDIVMSISVTTRPPRANEIDGRDYHFVTDARFEELEKSRQLLEWATVFGFRYGTPQAPVAAILDAGRDVLFDIDWQGAQQLEWADAAADLVRIFILPPSLAELERRLRTRATDRDDVVAARMQRAEAEISHWNEYDYILVNDDPDVCLGAIRAILKAERLRRSRQPGLAGFVAALLSGSRASPP